jgi:hypothetical protein
MKEVKLVPIATALGSMDQLLPFQISINASDPTATQWVESVHEIPRRVPWPSALFGLGTTDQVDPFQVSTRVWPAPDALVKDPTAMQSLAAGHETP